MHPSTTTTENFIFIITVLCFGCLTSLFAYHLGYYTLPKEQEKTTLTFMDVVKVFFIFLCVPLVMVPALFMLIIWIQTGNFPSSASLSVSEEMQGWLNIILIGLTTAALLLFYFCLGKNKKRSILRSKAFHFFSCIEGIKMGGVTWLVAFPLVVGIGQLVAMATYWFFDRVPLEQVAVKQLKASLNDPFLFWVVSFGIVGIVPFLEEFIFRGCLQTWVKQRFGLFFSIVFSAFIFACFHFSPSQGIGNTELIISLTILGSYLGFIYERQQSLSAPYALHAVFNGVSTLLIALE